VSKQINIQEVTKIVISRTDSIGDVVLTLPMCVRLKKEYPKAKIIFLAAAYTIPVIECCKSVDEIINWTELKDRPRAEKIEIMRSWDADVLIHVFPNKEIANLAKKSKIPHRIGTSHRTFHFLTCNHRVSFTRKKSENHESQLNFHLLEPLDIIKLPSFEQVKKDMDCFKAPALNSLPIEPTKELKTVILHPKSQGSAVEWPMSKYTALSDELEEKGYRVYVTGTEKEGSFIEPYFKWGENIVNTTGTMSLTQLISFIGKCDHLVACSTGPLHLAGVQNVTSIGLFSPRRPIHPGRWRPLGNKSTVLTSRDTCPCDRKRGCSCIEAISVDQVINVIEQSKIL
jgi:heptosyltransferase-3